MRVCVCVRAFLDFILSVAFMALGRLSSEPRCRQESEEGEDEEEELSPANLPGTISYAKGESR